MAASFHTSSVARNLQHAFEQLPSRKFLPEAFSFSLRRMDNFGNAAHDIPNRLTLLRPNGKDASLDQLFLDCMPLPRDMWSYDSHDRILTWESAFGGARIMLAHAGQGGGSGTIGPALNPVSVEVSATANFMCDMALNTGATCQTSGEKLEGFVWNPQSATWTEAKWTNNRLLLSYTVTTGGPFAPPTFFLSFTDNETGAIPWDATDFTAALVAGTSPSGAFVWDLDFIYTPGVPPAEIGGIAVGPDEPDTVYPYFLNIVEDAAAMSLTGVMMIDDTTVEKGVLVGIQGNRQNALFTGYYRSSNTAAPFGVFDGKIVVDGKPIAGTHISGNSLTWSELPTSIQKRTHLPSAGTVNFLPDGSSAMDDVGALSLNRLSSSAAIAALARHNDFHPSVGQRTRLAAEASPGLSILGILAMNPFIQNASATWYDAVQAAVLEDMNAIMNSFIPSDMWNLLFPNTPQPQISGNLSAVAATPVNDANGKPVDVAAWYSSLGVALMTSGMSNGSDENCHNMNGTRANAWLKSQVAISPVYNAHSQLLFNDRWAERFPPIAQYLSDQNVNAGTYAPQIMQQVDSVVDDINKNVAPDPNVPDLISDLTKKVQDEGNYATTNQLYWAFAFYTYNTSPAILANIAMQMSVLSGSPDDTALTRMFQQNASILTALDPSGFFSRQYTQTLNVFMATNILPSMFSFEGVADTFTMIKLYLQNFVNQNINSEDSDIANAANQIQSILQDQQGDKILTDSILLLRSISGVTQDALALPIVAEKFLMEFTAKFPRLAKVANVFGSLVIGGVAALAIVNLITGFQSWDKMTDAQKEQLILDASQIGLQIVAAVVKRGIRIYSMFGVEGMTAMERAASISKIMVTGEDALDGALLRIGNSTARWLGSAEGTVVFPGSDMEMVVLDLGTDAAEESALLTKVLGKNLDEFVGARLAPVFIVAGICYSIYNLVEGEETLQTVSDALNIAGGSLMLLSMVATEGGLITAVAGPLAIVAAVAGVVIMIVEMTKKPPDPVKEFVENYVTPNGLFIAGTASSIDYVTAYINPDQGGLQMIGFTLGAGGTSLLVGPNGTISSGAATALPNAVWQVKTDGLGMSQIFTYLQPDVSAPPIVALLSLLADNKTVTFQPRMPSGPVDATSVVVTQTWLSTPSGTATLSSNNHLAELSLSLQAVLPDSKGNYDPSQAAGNLIQTDTGLTCGRAAGTGFTLVSAAVAPAFLAMRDVDIVFNSTPSTTEVFSPAFLSPASLPLTFALTPAPPVFLTFDPTTGKLSPNGQVATPVSSTTMTVVATNAKGSASTSYTLSVA